MAEPRLKAGLWVKAALRMADRDGRSGVVLRKGDADSGGVLVVLRGREGLVVLSQVRTLDGALAWMRGTGAAAVDQAAVDAYVERQMRLIRMCGFLSSMRRTSCRRSRRSWYDGVDEECSDQRRSEFQWANCRSAGGPGDRASVGGESDHRLSLDIRYGRQTCLRGRGRSVRASQRAAGARWRAFLADPGRDRRGLQHCSTVWSQLRAQCADERFRSARARDAVTGRPRGRRAREAA